MDILTHLGDNVSAGQLRQAMGDEHFREHCEQLKREAMAALGSRRKKEGPAR